MNTWLRHLRRGVGLWLLSTVCLNAAGPAEKAAAQHDPDQPSREALLANPLVRGQPILFVVRQQYRPDHHNTATFFPAAAHEYNDGAFTPGSALKVIDLGQGGRVRSLLEVPEGVLRDPEVHFDGRRLVFSMRRNAADSYHLYEIQTDGSGLRQLTFARDVDDLDPLYLPDDSIVFSSTREPKYCMCNRHIMANLFRMDRDGANIHQIGKSTLFEGHASLLPDGRILYDRWEYVDRNFGDAQALWTVNPDGTAHTLYWGNNTAAPGAVIDARAIPGTDQAICVFGSCHDRPWGALAILDRRLAPALAGPARLQALPQPPATLDGWHGPARDFSYRTEVQPVFDRHCVRCHDFGTSAGQVLNLAGDRDLAFNTSYNELWRKKYIRVVGAGPPETQAAYSWGAHASKLVATLRTRPRCGGTLSPEDWDRIVTWIDLNAPYYPSYASAYPDNLAGRSPLDDAQLARLEQLTGIPLRQLAGHANNRGPQISFDRPELSPCLVRFTDKADPKYQEALAVICSGQERLARRPEADAPGFQPSPLDQWRNAKYLARQQREQQNRAALRTGAKLLESGQESSP
jgi:hypothetical protein